MNVLFVNSTAQECGVFQFGLNLFRIIKQSTKHTYHYCAPKNALEMLRFIHDFSADLVFYNFYPCTMPWVTLDSLNAVRRKKLKQITIFHEVPVTGFDAYVYPDPTFTECSKNLAKWFSIGRPLPSAKPMNYPDRKIPVIGTSGFGFTWKGHARLARMVVQEFDEAVIRMHLPFAKFGDESGNGARSIARECKEISASKPGIKVEVDHQFMPTDQFVEWLAQNDLNAYLYDESNKSRGIASTVDHALAARKAIALTKTWMFRHLHHIPDIFIENKTLKQILDLGPSPLIPVYFQYEEWRMIKKVDAIMDEVSGLSAGHNRILTNTDRAEYSSIIEEMRVAIPDIMARKIPEANVQQAWIFDSVRAANPQKILCVGCFEDSAFEMLSREREVTGIDPAVNWSLSDYRARHPDVKFDCVFATSVMEHVSDDEGFLRDICGLLNPDGVAFLTVDFKNDWKTGDPLPATDERFYTEHDILRLKNILTEQGCYFIDRPDTECVPDFVYQGHIYGFLALTFKKL